MKEKFLRKRCLCGYRRPKTEEKIHCPRCGRNYSYLFRFRFRKPVGSKIEIFL